MKKERNGITLLLLAYSLAMLPIMTCTIFLLSKRLGRAAVQTPSTEAITEKYIYIYRDSEETERDEIAEDAWIVKEHEKRIGVFSAEGELLKLLDVYTNTLPMADQRLLREGIVVTTQADLYALIEDYSE